VAGAGGVAQLEAIEGTERGEQEGPVALQAVREGLATCWIGSFFADQVRQLLGIPEHIAIIEVLPLGYPADQAGPKKRVSMAEIACYDRWGF